MFKPVPLFVGLRYTRTRKRNLFVSFVSVISMLGITLGVLATDQWVGDRTIISSNVPASALAQREIKWLVQYHGNTTGKKFTCEIPTADLEGRVLPGTDLADLTNTEMAAFVTAFQTIARSPDSDQETVTIDAVRVVGRNI